MIERTRQGSGYIRIEKILDKERKSIESVGPVVSSVSTIIG